MSAALARRAIGDVSRRSAEVFGKTRRIFKPRANLLAVEINGDPPHAYHIKLLFHVDTSSNNVSHVQPAAFAMREGDSVKHPRHLPTLGEIRPQGRIGGDAIHQVADLHRF